jgi:hypothetical protein
MVNNKVVTIFEKIILINNQVKNILLNKIEENYLDEDLLKFLEISENEHLLANPEIVKKVAVCLQLFNNEKYYNQVSLESVKELYSLLIDISPYDISLYESLGYFLDNVLGETDNAKQVVSLGIEKISSKVAELKAVFS